MLEDVKYNQNNVHLSDKNGVNPFASKKQVYFTANPNAVDTTPTADTYSPQTPQLPPEMGFGEKFVKYMIPTWMGLYLGTELFNKANGGEYEKSLVGRLGRLGDRLSQTSLLRNRFVTGIKNKSQSAKAGFQNFVDKHQTLSAMQKTPTAPECSFVTSFIETQAEADIKEGASGLSKFLKKNPKTLKLAGATEAEIAALKSKYGTGLFGRINNEKKAVEEFLLGKLGTEHGRPNIIADIEARDNFLTNQLESYRQELRDPNISNRRKKQLRKGIERLTEQQKNHKNITLRRLKLKSMGMTAPMIENAIKHPAGYAQNIEHALENTSRYSTSLKHVHNKVKSISAPVSKLGKFLPKVAKLGVRGLTFGGGLFNSLFIAFFLADGVKNTIDAPKDQKVGTFAAGLLDAMSWVIAMPLSIKAMHSVNGLKNLGKSKQQVDTYKDALKAFNRDVKAGNLTDKRLYDQAYQRLMNLKNVGTPPTGFKKVLSKVAQFLSISLEQPARYREATKGLPFSQKIAPFFRNFGRNLPNIAKECVGFPLRFALYAMVFAPIVEKTFSFVTSAIFGKPFEPDKIREEQEKAQETAQMEEMRRRYLYPGPAITPNPRAISGLESLDINSLPDNNLIKQELIRRGIVKPGSSNTQNVNTQGYPNSVSGVSVNIKHDAEPFMPNVNGQNCQNNNPNVVINNQADGQGKTNEKDPNKSDYDTVPRTYVPKLNPENPVPYSDPLANPNYEHNYDNMRESVERSDKFIRDTEELINNKFRD